MAVTTGLALAVLAACGLYFVALGLAGLFAPARATRFLHGFAATPRAHYAELLVRWAVGGAMLVAAPLLPATLAFQTFGLVLVATTAVLFLLPWRWHQRFAAQAVPRATRHIGLLGLASLALGVALLVALAGAYWTAGSPSVS